jgi:ketosteroid isomerase-like protein
MFLRILFFTIASVSVLAQSVQPAKPSSADQIRSIRQELDKAFAQHDATKLSALFTTDCHFTALKVHIDGSDVLERFHKSLFVKRPDVILTHNASRIDVNEAWDVASEQGEWIERWTEKDGTTELRGTYLTMWKRDNNRWLEFSEMIVPQTCSGGSYCR